MEIGNRRVNLAYDVMRLNLNFCQQVPNPIRICEDTFLDRPTRRDIQSGESERL